MLVKPLIACSFGLFTAVTLAAQAPLLEAPKVDAPPDVTEHLDGVATSVTQGSQVRIVRLSQVLGNVQMDRKTSGGFEPAFANLPVVQGAEVRTQEGLAEVEFEDNSSLRLAPTTEMTFERLGRSASGMTETSFHLQQGTLYLSLSPSKGNEYGLKVAGAAMVFAPETHMRVDVYPAGSELTIFKGSASVNDASGTHVVGKGMTLHFTASDAKPLTVTRNEAPGLYDKWDKQSVNYHQARVNSFVGGQFGAADLQYYGSFNNVAGCGQVWQPYFTSAAWNPYASGVWALYAGTGYSFVSPYPWGWLPYHSGNWVSCGGSGWGWQPDSNWRGVNNIQSSQVIRKPHAPHDPSVPRPSLVPVGMPAIHRSEPGTTGKFNFVKDSAGMGVPRTAFGNLSKMSQNVETHGVAQITMPSTVAVLSPEHPIGSTGATGGGMRQTNPGGPAGASGFGSREASMTPMGRPTASSGSSFGSSHGSSSGSSSNAGSSGGGNSFSSSSPSSASSSGSSISTSGGGSASASSGGSHK